MTPAEIRLVSVKFSEAEGLWRPCLRGTDVPVLDNDGLIRGAFFDRSEGVFTWTCTRHTLQGDQVGDAEFHHSKAAVWRWLKTGSWRAES